MQDERNASQIIRKDARNCFVESLSDAFGNGRAHFAFATYDMNKPAGQRQTNNIHIYISVPELLELCRKLSCGELRYIMQQKKQTGDPKPIQEWLGGTSAEKLRQYGKARPDGKSLSRVCKLLADQKTDFLLVADSGPGDKDAKGLIVPRFGNKPENHVAVSMTFDALSELLLMTKTHYESWLTAWYLSQAHSGQKQAAVPTRKRSTLSTALPGVRPESSSVSILPGAVWLLYPADCRSAAGTIRTAISDVLLRWSQIMCTLAIPRATALPPVPRQLLLQATAPLRILHPTIRLRIFRCWRMTMLSCRFNRREQP